MNTILVITNRGVEDDVCRLFLPYWAKSGCPLLFTSPFDDRSQLDGVLHFFAGRSLGRYADSWWFYQARVLETMRHVLTLPFGAYIFTQYDSICLAPLPAIDRNDSIHNMACGPVDGFRAKRGLHPPWCFGRDRLADFVREAAKHDIQTTEQGVMDRWLPFVLEQACSGYPESPYEHASWSFSRNGIDTPEHVAAARKAITEGATFIHGVKNQEQLRSILS